MKKLLLVLLFVLFGFTCQAQIPSSLYSFKTPYPQQVVNGNSMFPFLPMCAQRVDIGKNYIVRDDYVNHCGSPRNYVNIGETVNIWTNTYHFNNCNHLHNPFGYPVVFFVDIVLQGCDPFFGSTYSFPFAHQWASELQMIFPEGFVPQYQWAMQIFGVYYWTYWSEMVIPPNPSLVGSWLTVQSARLDPLDNLVYFSNRVDGLVHYKPVTF